MLGDWCFVEGAWYEPGGPYQSGPGGGLGM